MWNNPAVQQIKATHCSGSRTHCKWRRSRRTQFSAPCGSRFARNTRRAHRQRSAHPPRSSGCICRVSIGAPPKEQYCIFVKSLLQTNVENPTTLYEIFNVFYGSWCVSNVLESSYDSVFLYCLQHNNWSVKYMIYSKLNSIKLYLGDAVHWQAGAIRSHRQQTLPDGSLIRKAKKPYTV